jgi:hypothetical protein
LAILAIKEIRFGAALPRQRPTMAVSQFPLPPAPNHFADDVERCPRDRKIAHGAVDSTDAELKSLPPSIRGDVVPSLVPTRYDKLAANYLAFVQLASIRLWLAAR